MTHAKPCVIMHVFTRHIASHVSTCMELKFCINGRSQTIRRRMRGSRKGKDKGRKEEKRKGKEKGWKEEKSKEEKRRKMRKKENEKRERKEEKKGMSRSEQTRTAKNPELRYKR